RCPLRPDRSLRRDHPPLAAGRAVAALALPQLAAHPRSRRRWRGRDPSWPTIKNAAELWHTGTWVVFVDENTSIQARAPERAPQPAGPGHPGHTDPRYIRQGAVSLLGLCASPTG
ncbi:MAG: hypothetical protein M3Z04_22930, partial [Chloroflexota bacterium]|nr:hypothetical protein [Chloroflexota bacterium]